MKLEDQVMTIVRDNTEEKEGITLASDLRQDLRLDSFGTLMVINAIEDAYGIAVDETEFGPVRTVADMVTLLRSKYHCQ